MDVRRVIEPDAIPSIDDPDFGGTYFGSDVDQVLVLEGPPSKAYPIRFRADHPEGVVLQPASMKGEAASDSDEPTKEGMEAYESPGFDFDVTHYDGGVVEMHADGTAWNPVADTSAVGRRLDRLPE